MGGGLAFPVHLLAGAWSGGVAGAGAGVLSAVLGLIACAVVPLFLYRVGGIGGGDVKLLAVVGALVGPIWGLEAEFYSFGALILYAPARLAYDGRLLVTLANSMALIANAVLPKDKRRSIAPELMTSLRFGPAVFVGSAVASFMHWRLQ
jgi:prepilin peptidase CpaA